MTHCPVLSPKLSEKEVEKSPAYTCKMFKYGLIRKYHTVMVIFIIVIDKINSREFNFPLIEFSMNTNLLFQSFSNGIAHTICYVDVVKRAWKLRYDPSIFINPLNNLILKDLHFTTLFNSLKFCFFGKHIDFVISKLNHTK